MVEHHANVPLYLHLNNQTILNKAKSGSLILHTLSHKHSQSTRTVELRQTTNYTF